MSEAPKTWYLPRADIHPDPRNPRSDFGNLEELAASIKSYGIVQPIVVRAATEADAEFTNGEPWVIVAGERRFRAAALLGIDEVPCTPLAEVTVGARRTTASTAERNSIPECATVELALVENLQRQDLTAMDEAYAFRALLDGDKELNAVILATRIGRSTDYVRKRLYLCDLPAATRDLVGAGKLPLNAALCIRALAGKGMDTQLNELTALAVRKQWPTKKVEASVAALLQTPTRAAYARDDEQSKVPSVPPPAAQPPAAEKTALAPQVWQDIPLPPMGASSAKLLKLVTEDGVNAVLVVLRDERTLARVDQAIRETVAAVRAERDAEAPDV